MSRPLSDPDSRHLSNLLASGRDFKHILDSPVPDEMAVRVSNWRGRLNFALLDLQVALGLDLVHRSDSIEAAVSALEAEARELRRRMEAPE